MGEVLAAKRKEMEEKYADIINDFLTKYGGTSDQGFNYFITFARIEHENRKKKDDEVKFVQPYETEIEFDMEELLKDYAEYLELCNDKARAEGLIGIE